MILLFKAYYFIKLESFSKRLAPNHSSVYFNIFFLFILKPFHCSFVTLQIWYIFHTKDIIPDNLEWDPISLDFILKKIPRIMIDWRSHYWSYFHIDDQISKLSLDFIQIGGLSFLISQKKKTLKSFLKVKMYDVFESKRFYSKWIISTWVSFLFYLFFEI